MRYVGINVCLILLMYQDIAALTATWKIVERNTFPNVPSVRELFIECRIGQVRDAAGDTVPKRAGFSARFLAAP